MLGLVRGEFTLKTKESIDSLITKVHSKPDKRDAGKDRDGHKAFMI